MTEPNPPQQPRTSPPPASAPTSQWAQYQRQAVAWPEERGTPGSVIFVGILLILLGLLAGIFGLILAFAGPTLQQMGTLGVPVTDPATGEVMDAEVALETVSGIVAVIGWVLLVVALAHLASGIGVMLRAGWARVLGIVVAIVGLLLWGLVALASLAAMAQPEAGQDAIGAVVLSLVVALIYLFSFIVLARRGDAFRRAVT